MFSDSLARTDFTLSRSFLGHQGGRCAQHASDGTQAWAKQNRDCGCTFEQRVYHLLDARLAIPEFLVDVDFVPFGEGRVSPAIRASQSPTSPSSSSSSSSSAAVSSRTSPISSLTTLPGLPEPVASRIRDVLALAHSDGGRAIALYPPLISPPTATAYVTRMGALSVQSLTLVDVAHQQLTTLPELDQLVGLQELRLSFNFLTSLIALSNAPLLRVVDASFNRVTQLNDLRNMAALTSLDVRSNALTLFDDLLHLCKHAPRLESLDTRWNAYEGVLETGELASVLYERAPALRSLNAKPKPDAMDACSLRVREGKDVFDSTEPVFHVDVAARCLIREYELDRARTRAHRRSPAIASQTNPSHTDLASAKASEAASASGSASSAPQPPPPVVPPHPAPVAQADRPSHVDLEAAMRRVVHLHRAPRRVSCVWVAQALEAGMFSYFALPGGGASNAMAALCLDNGCAQHFRDLPRISNLQFLSLDDNRFWRLRELQLCPTLLELSLQNNLLYKVNWLAGLTSLRRLDLSRNCIRSLDGVQSLVCLEELAVDANQINVLEPLGTLTQLRQLYISDNAVDSAIQVCTG